MWKIAFRHMLRQRFYAGLNLLGLAVGMASCLLMLLYLVDEYSYDRFHEKADRIYRVDQTNIWADTGVPFGSTGPAVAHALRAEIPEAEAITRLHTPGNLWLSAEDPAGQEHTFGEEDILAADSNFFEVFSFELLEGNPATSLRLPNTIVVTETAAKRYFGTASALGKQIQIEQGSQLKNCTVTGVLRDLPDASHFHFDGLLSMNSIPRVKRQEGWTWIWTTFVTYMLVKEGTDISTVEARLPAIPPKHAEATVKNIMNVTFDDFIKQGKSWDLYLMPLTDIRLYSGQTNNRLGPVGDIQQVSMLGIVALLILILSCINFMNLATARASRRAREIGVKKVLGAGKGALIRQFLLESLVFSFVATILGVALAELSIDAFNTLANKELIINPISHPWLIPFILGMSVMMGLLAGSYPAFYLTAFQPVHVLKGQLASGMKSGLLRNVLVTFQFAISIGLIICTLLVYEQLQFTRDKDLGFEPDNLMVIEGVEKMEGQEKVLKEAVQQLAVVQQGALSNLTPPRIYNQEYFKALDGAPDQELPMSIMEIDEDYLPLLGVEMAHGRAFRSDQPAEASHVILNETAVRVFGWGSPADSAYVPPIGKRLQYLGGNIDPFEVIGVFEDFNFWSLHYPIEPLAMFTRDAPIYDGGRSYLSIRLSEQIHSGDDLTAAIAAIQGVWEELKPGLPFTYTFVDQDFYASFQAEQQLGKVLGVFTFLAIFIACLGLLGLTAYSVEQRTQEIGIRKVLGASALQIVSLLSRSVVKWLLIAFVLASPVAIWVIDGWLTTFAYRITIGPQAFILAGVMAFVVAAITMGFHAWQATRINPIEALRDE